MLAESQGLEGPVVVRCEGDDRERKLSVGVWVEVFRCLGWRTRRMGWSRESAGRVLRLVRESFV